MDFLQLAAQRYSVRKFQEKKLPREVLESILKAGMLAPTAHNNQPQRILVIDTKGAGSAGQGHEVPLRSARRAAGLL